MRIALKTARGLVLLWALLALTACGGGGSSPPPQQTASLGYPSGTQTFVVGTAITALTPTVTGSLTTFSISPALPAGLTLNTGTGAISGTPTAAAAVATYTVTASGSGGVSATASVSIVVNAVSPSNISYGASALTFSAGVQISVLKPSTSGGSVVSWSVSPALPQGLNFSTTDGTISGNPTAPSVGAQYLVTAQNSGGQSTATLTITVDVAPVVNLGHQNGIAQIRATATRVLSIDTSDYWVLWDYATAAVIASGNSGCSTANPCTLTYTQSPLIDMAGTTAVLVTPTGLEAHATSDGHITASIVTSGRWWRLATDGSYIATGGSTGLSIWSTSGQLLFTRAGDYSKANAFAAPGQVMVGTGAAGSNVIETITVPGNADSTGPTFNGTFSSWFLDGGSFISVAGSTALVYSNASVQQGSITPVNTTYLVGQGSWVWTYPSPGGVLNIYPATGNGPAATATYTFSALTTPVASGSTIGFLPEGSSTVSVIDLSGATPTKTDYNSGVSLGTGISSGQPYAAVSASQWLVGSNYGVLIDGTTFAGTERLFGYGQAWSIAGGTGHFAVATASGNILYFNSATLALEGRIPFYASKISLSADGTTLVAMGAGATYGQSDVEVYGLPAAGSPLYTWTYTVNGAGGSLLPQDVELSGSGSVLGQVTFDSRNGSELYTQEASAPTGGSQVFSSSFSSQFLDVAPPLRISPDGTLIAYSQSGSPTQEGGLNPGTNLLLNGTLVTAVNGLTVGWLDNTRLVVNSYAQNSSHLPVYTGCTLYGANGAATGAPCSLPYEVNQFQVVSTDGIYVPQANQIVSVSNGSISWMSGNPDFWSSYPLHAVGAVTGSHVIFVSGIDLVAQSY